jgi:murein DD-endopeptidase MepM/ murein hydrolase activator NlpD
MAIGKGIVVYSSIHLGKLAKDGTIKKRNWGGVVIIAHHNTKNKLNFFSVYGHLGKCLLKKGDVIDAGKVIGTIGKSMTPKNGLWEEEHLHFGIYTGPFDGKVLPGYYKKEAELTKMEYWQEPISFIKDYK